MTVADPPYEVVCRADDPRWLEHRKSGIGASEAAGLIGASPWISQLELYALKTGAKPPKDLSGVEVVDWGHRLEPVIITAFRDRTGRFVDHGGLLLRSKRHPWALATLDAWCAVE